MISKVIKKVVKKILGKTSSSNDYMNFLISQGLKVGKNLRNHSFDAFDALFPWLISVGDNVCISSNVRILTHDTSTEYVNGYTKIGIVDIGDNVYIGHNSTILCNVRIGSNSIIGAGSVVTKDVPEGSVFAGNPAKFICTIQEYKQKHEEYLKRKPIYDGPYTKWREYSLEEKEKMKKELNDQFGYM